MTEICVGVKIDRRERGPWGTIVFGADGNCVSCHRTDGSRVLQGDRNALYQVAGAKAETLFVLSLLCLKSQHMRGHISNWPNTAWAFRVPMLRRDSASCVVTTYCMLPLLFFLGNPSYISSKIPHQNLNAINCLQHLHRLTPRRLTQNSRLLQPRLFDGRSADRTLFK